MIRQVVMEDAAQICDIYNHYVSDTPITFEEQPVTISEMESRIGDTLKSLPWLVWEEDQRLLGYCYANRWKARSAYRYSVEASVYLRSDARGKGIGSQLYAVLLAALRERKLHTVIGGVALPNPSSVALLEKFGFEKTAHFKQVGNKFGQWIDVGYWQLIL